jgi:hypothetical protein
MTIYQSLEVEGECNMVDIAPGAITFTSNEMQEQVKALSHIDLHLSKLPIEMLQGLQVNITQELNLRIEKTSNELVKVTTENIVLHIDYNIVTMKGMGYAEGRKDAKIIQTTIQELPEVPMEVYIPI